MKRQTPWLIAAIVVAAIFSLAARQQVDHRALLEPLAAKVGTPSNLDDESRRAYTFKLAQQLNFSFASDGAWCQVRNVSGTISADKIILKGTSTAYDVMSGTADSPAIVWQWVSVQAEGVGCIEAPAHDWIGGGAPPPVDPPPGPDLSALTARVAALEALAQDQDLALRTQDSGLRAQAQQLAALAARVEAIEAKPTRTIICEPTSIGTSRSWAHAHAVVVPACRVQ